MTLLVFLRMQSTSLVCVCGRYGLWYPDHVYAKNHVGYKWHQVEDVTSLIANNPLLQCALQNEASQPTGALLVFECNR